MTAPHVEFDVPEDLAEEALEVVELARNSGKVKKGTNETTKALERGKAKFVVIAEDVKPPEIVMHLAPLCKDKDIPFIYVPGQRELGTSAGLEVASASVAITDLGEADKRFREIKKEIDEIK